MTSHLRRIGFISALLAIIVAGLTTSPVTAQTPPTADRGGPAPGPAASGPDFQTFFGVNDYYDGAAEFSKDPNYSSQLDQLAPGTLRWPGGTGADFFDWHTGRPPKSPFPYDFTLEDLRTHARATNAIPIFDLNVLKKANRTDPSDQVQMLQHAKSLGLAIKYVELGNELYFDGPSGAFKQGFPTGADYGKTVAIYVDALHKTFPGVQVAAVGCLNPTNPREKDWNAQMLTAATHANGAPDAVTLHYYPGPNIKGFTGTQDQLSRLFAGAYNAIQHIDTVANRAPLAGRPIWLTEFNLAPKLLSGNTPEQLTYAHELYLAAFMLMLPRIHDAALVDAFTGFAKGPVFAAWDDPSNPTFTPVGQAMQAVDQAALNRLSSRAITVAGAPTLGKGEAAVLGQAFLSPGLPPNAVIVNLTASTQRVPVGTDISAGSPYTSVSGTPGANLTVAPRPSGGTVAGPNLALQPYSITEVGLSTCAGPISQAPCQG